MPKLQTFCPICIANYKAQELAIANGQLIKKADRLHLPKAVEQVSEFNLGNKKFIKYSCNHLVPITLLAKSELAVTSKDGKTLYPFQQDSLAFMRESGFRTLLNLDMGLGKTPITCAAFKAFPELLPAIVVCKSSLKAQWMKMLYNWADILPEIIENGKDSLMPDIFPVAIISFDLLRRMNIPEETRSQYKTIIIDETQNIKSPDTKRTQEVRALAKGITNVIGLSGTPIKNNGTEYFTILNMLRSDLFGNYNSFCWNWVDNYWDGRKMKYGGIKRYTEFKERTKDFIIRYTRDEVMPDLPKIFRKEQFCDLGKEVQKAYEKELTKFQEAYDAGEFNTNSGFMNLLAYMARMRHLTGIAKVKACLDYLETFLLETDRKIIIFCHHKDVMELLRQGLDAIRSETSTSDTGEETQFELFAPPVMYVSEMNSFAREQAIEDFKASSTQRIMIASTLSIQEGVNLQPVSDCIMLERQWNPANEEQAEARFPRPGATADRIDATYFIAIGTIDEYFAELVERKRQICKSTLGDVVINWDETSLIKELATILASKGNKKWTL